MFTAGLDLARDFYRELVAPLLPRDLEHSAALIGPGSDVLGYDDEMSTDHDWGPAVQVFVPEARLGERDAWRDHLAKRLPRTFRGHPTSFEPADRAAGRGSVPSPAGQTRVNHRVRFTTIERFLRRYLALDTAGALTNRQWLALPSQRLGGLLAGGVFRDDLGLAEVRTRLAWYPDDVWLHLMAATWRRIAQEEHLMGRAAWVGDDLGSRLIAARLVRDAMNLGFLIERRYAPYPKWFGTAFARLRSSERLQPLLDAALAAVGLEAREDALCTAFEILGQLHDALGVTPALRARRTRFHDRPFQVIDAERFVRTLCAAIDDPELAGPRVIGGVNALSDNTDFLEAVEYGREVFATLPPPAEAAGGS